MFVRISNREDPGQTASSNPGLCCLSRPFQGSHRLEKYLNLEGFLKTS